MTNKTRKKQRTYKVYMFRHGVSCSNLARRLNNDLEANLYTDPELTEGGISMAKHLKPYALKQIRKPFVTGVSNLLRTHQTAYHLLNPKKMYIIPYINEFGENYQENHELPRQLQEELLKMIDRPIIKLRDYSYYDKVEQVGEEQQLGAFMKWLGANVNKITDHGSKSLVLVSHYGFINDVIKHYVGFGPENIFNCEMIEMDVSIRNKEAHIDYLKRISYDPKKFKKWDPIAYSKNHGCRLSIGKNRKPIKRRETYTRETRKKKNNPK